MNARILVSQPDGSAALEVDRIVSSPPPRWTWIDIEVGGSSSEEIATYLDRLQLDPLGLRDAVDESDLPKVDDLGSQMLIVLHGLRIGEVQTYEIDCFLTSDTLVTIRHEAAPAIDALWSEVQTNAVLASGTVDILAGHLADVIARRLLAVLEQFDDKVDGLIELALTADVRTIGEITAIRSDLSALRRIVHPQREVFDLLRLSSSALITAEGRRRFSDVFDVADRAATELIIARGFLAETLDAYRGAEARKATDVTKVLTVYAAIMLPLTLITGFFGMNFVSMPGLDSEWGWIVVVVVMIVIAALSLGVFIASDWIRRPSGRAAGATLGRGLIEAAWTPAHVTGAVLEISTMPLRSSSPARRLPDDPRDPHDPQR